MANLNDKLVDYKSLKENTKLTLGEAIAYDKGLAGGYNGDFPLTVATKGNIYRVPATNKFYMCITDYNGSNLTAPNANFEELSVWANRDKLENLYSSFQKVALKKGEEVRVSFREQGNRIYLVASGHLTDGILLLGYLNSNNLTIIKQSHFFEIIQGSLVSPLRILNREYEIETFYFVPLGFFDTKLNLEIVKIG